MNTKQFLTIGGVILIVYGVLGLIIADQPLLGGILYWTGIENLIHIVLGIVAIAAAFVLNAQFQKWLVAVVGVVALLAFVVGLFLLTSAPPNLGLASLELIDTIIHLVVGVWAIWVAFFRPAPAAQPAPRTA